MEIIAKSSEIRSTLHGVIADTRYGVKLTFRVLFFVGKRYKGEITFRDLTELVDYLMSDCGFDLIIFKDK